MMIAALHVEPEDDATQRTLHEVIRSAEASERARIVRWLKSVAETYRKRSRVGSGEEAVYWSDQVQALTHAAEAIARQRHTRPH